MTHIPDSNSLEFTEIEHKFVVEEGFQLEGFVDLVESLEPRSHHRVRVTDTYFVCDLVSGHVFRHRFDAKLQHLTIKSLEDDSESRLEVNLDLGHRRGNQAARVREFLRPMGIAWSGEVAKDVRAWYFDDCEIVHYVASGGGDKIACVEFEARTKQSIEQALAILRDYEARCGFTAVQRTTLTLFELLLVPGMSASLRTRFER